MSRDLGCLGHLAWVTAVRNRFRYKWHWDSRGPSSPRRRGEIRRWVCPPERCISESGRRICSLVC